MKFAIRISRYILKNMRSAPHPYSEVLLYLCWPAKLRPGINSGYTDSIIRYRTKSLGGEMLPAAQIEKGINISITTFGHLDHANILTRSSSSLQGMRGLPARPVPKAVPEIIPGPWTP